MQVYSRFPCISGLSPKQVASVIFRQFLSREHRWRIAEDAPFAFQEGVKDTRKMNTTVYINEQGTVLYLEGIGD